MKLTRREIIEGNYCYPQDFITLRSTRHFEQRLKERSMGLDVIPTMVRITKDNVHSAKTKDGVNLSSVVIRLKYNSFKNLFLVFSPQDGALKSLWFKERVRNVKDKSSSREDSGQTVSAH